MILAGMLAILLVSLTGYTAFSSGLLGGKGAGINEEMPLPDSESIDSISDGLPPVAIIRAREVLSSRLGIDIAEIEIVSWEGTTFSDSCLGLGGAAESCLQVMVTGYLVELSASEEIYIAHTDELGDVVRWAEDGAATIGMPVPGLEGVDEAVVSSGMPVPGIEGVEETIVIEE